MTLDDKTNRRLDRLSYLCLAVFIGCLGYVMFESITVNNIDVKWGQATGIESINTGYQFEIPYPYLGYDSFNHSKIYQINDSEINIILFEKTVDGKFKKLQSNDDTACSMKDPTKCEKLGTIWYVDDGQTRLYAGFNLKSDYSIDVTETNASRPDFGYPMNNYDLSNDGIGGDLAMPLNMTLIKYESQKFYFTNPQIVIPISVQESKP